MDSSCSCSSPTIPQRLCLIQMVSLEDEATHEDVCDSQKKMELINDITRGFELQERWVFAPKMFGWPGESTI